MAGLAYETEIRLQNPLQEPVYIFEVEPSCGCITSGFTRGELKAGKDVELKISISSREHLGKWQEIIRFFSTSDLLNALEIRIKGNVIPGPKILTPLDFHTFTSEEGAHVLMALEWPSIQEDSPASQHLDWSYSEVNPSIFVQENSLNWQDHVTTMDVHCAPSSFRGLLGGFLIAQLPDQPGATLRIPVNGAAIPLIIASPNPVPRALLAEGKELIIVLAPEGLSKEKIIFPQMQGQEGGVAWTLERGSTDEGQLIERVLLKGVPSRMCHVLHIPFETLGKEFNVLLRLE